ncbi:hypothetical protein LRD18_11235 [Halorhodospira halochloris]|uniref:hypothetical protein n=1 Tax=Halorhodospira halochloris TaxID=1052 RepID=UPI001EE86807|nr:hypothetical protein [Halorhodospira halochloris]MCG5531418.1 hypothetical protein [Halorhodospira halochloris]
MADEESPSTQKQGSLLSATHNRHNPYGHKIEAIRDLIEDDPERAVAVIKLWLEETQSNGKEERP